VSYINMGHIRIRCIPVSDVGMSIGVCAVLMGVGVSLIGVPYVGVRDVAMTDVAMSCIPVRDVGMGVGVRDVRVRDVLVRRIAMPVSVVKILIPDIAVTVDVRGVNMGHITVGHITVGHIGVAVLIRDVGVGVGVAVTVSGVFVRYVIVGNVGVGGVIVAHIGVGRITMGVAVCVVAVADVGVVVGVTDVAVAGITVAYIFVGCIDVTQTLVLDRIEESKVDVLLPDRTLEAHLGAKVCAGEATLITPSVNVMHVLAICPTTSRTGPRRCGNKHPLHRPLGSSRSDVMDSGTFNPHTPGGLGHMLSPQQVPSPRGHLGQELAPARTELDLLQRHQPASQ
jgi:hypothetical protein